jgi:hypothetical protein
MEELSFDRIHFTFDDIPYVAWFTRTDVITGAARETVVLSVDAR